MVTPFRFRGWKARSVMATTGLLIVAALLAGLPPSAPARGEPGRGEIVCFVYHRFGDGRYPSTNIPVEVFAAQMALLHEGGYTVLPLGEALDRLQSQGGVPGKTVALTVDDGYRSFLTGAMPVLRKYGYRATLFINSDSVGMGDYLDWAELRGLVAEGIEIGNHSASHAFFLDLDPSKRLERFTADAVRAQEAIASHLGTKPGLYSYPYGEYDPDMKGAAEALGFAAAVAQRSGVIYEGSDRYALPRFPMGGPYATVRGFREKARMRALRVASQEPESTLMPDTNPPSLTLDLEPHRMDLRTMQCFVDGRRNCRAEPDPEKPNRITVVSNAPLAGRRSLYTITASTADGSIWYWYSHLWVRPEIPE